MTCFMKEQDTKLHDLNYIKVYKHKSSLKKKYPSKWLSLGDYN